MSSTEKVILRRFRELVSRQLAIHQLLLFGSRARGDADADSDMDLLVVLEETVDPASEDYVRQCAWEAGFDHGIVVVPVTVSREEWERGPLSSSLLALAVEREGIAV